MEQQTRTATSWFDRPITWLSTWNVEKILVVIILILALASRFYMVGARVMSHDEVNHVVPAYELFQGNGYRHDPVTHGPMQFHLLALSYFLLGDSDFSSRVPAALFSTAAIIFVLFAFRRYLGRKGAMIAAVMFLISPYMLFYGRYTRNEAFIELFGVVALYATLHYLETGKNGSLTLLTAAMGLHFTTKETAFIYMAQLLLFTFLVFLWRVIQQSWPSEQTRKRFILLMIFALGALVAALGLAIWNAALQNPPEDGAATVTQASEAAAQTLQLTPQLAGEVAALALAAVLALAGAVVLIRNLGWEAIRSERSFDILIMMGTVTLPQLTPFMVSIIGGDPLNYEWPAVLVTAVVAAVFFGISIAIGLYWKPKVWLGNAALFWVVFTVLYTTFFTNGRGFVTGLVGSLGYWLSQQGVERGSQPLYYYALIQIPMYEYLAALGTLLAAYFGLRYGRFWQEAGRAPADIPLPLVPTEEPDLEPGKETLKQNEAKAVQTVEPTAAETGEHAERLPVLALLIFWSVTSLAAYSFAGEKMPWLTVHIALPLILTAGWGLGFLVDTTPWKRVLERSGLLALALTPVFITSLASVFGSILGATPPFQGKELVQLESTNTFLLGTLTAGLTGWAILRFLKDWRWGDLLRLVTVTFFVILGVLTARTAATASYINYDNAKEFLVYAHAASGPKEVLRQVEEISRRTTGGKNIVVAYDNDALYPYWWYFRDYPNKRWFTDKPSRDLRDAPVIISGESTMGKLDPIVKGDYVKFSYMRLWWPMQDYFNLTWERIAPALTNPKMRAALWQIWLNRDYTQYAAVTGSQTLTLENWQPSSRMDVFIRKDVVGQIWNYGAVPVTPGEIETDPYEGKVSPLTPDLQIGAPGMDPGQLQAPRGIAAAADGSIYVADSRNHRIQHFSPEGELLHVWGSFADATAANAEAPGGTFNEPWGVAVGPDGSVYVADTWNHRVQKFTADGQFLTMWGYFGQAENPDAFWGPRDVAVDAQGRVYVTDTGNKRIAVFDGNGEFITQFGEAGMEPGQFDEQVGIALGTDGLVFITDTWNQRVQVFAAEPGTNNFTPLTTWEVYGWFGQSLDNKPYIAVDPANNVFVTDPEGPRVLKFDLNGKFLAAWGDYAVDSGAGTLYSGVAVDAERGVLWITDANGGRVLRMPLEALPMP